jgi:hypothetical protein
MKPIKLGSTWRNKRTKQEVVIWFRSEALLRASGWVKKSTGQFGSKQYEYTPDEFWRLYAHVKDPVEGEGAIRGARG